MIHATTQIARQKEAEVTQGKSIAAMHSEDKGEPLPVSEGDPDGFQKAFKPIRVRGSGIKATVTENSFQSLTIEVAEKAGELVATKKGNT